MQITIFNRTNKGVSISNEGDIFLSYVRQVLEQTSLLEEKFLNKTEQSPKFSVSCQHYSFAVNAFVDVIREFGGDRYDFTLRETQTYEIIEDVNRLKSEIGILYTSSKNEEVILKLIRQNGLKFEELFVAKPHVFISSEHPLAGKEVLDLERAGIRIIQIDEAALKEKLPIRKSDWYREYLDWAIPAFRLCHSGVKPETQIHTHMCYSEFNDIIRDIDNMDADVISFEASRSKLTILDAIKESNFETEVGPGLYDIHSPRVPSVEEIVTALNTMLTKISKDKLWVNPDCGLKTRGIPETDASLKNLVEAAKIVREKI